MQATKELLQSLSQLRSMTNGTSLVTMLIPSQFNLGIISKRLTAELSTSTNIKNKSVRNAVQSALGSALESIKNYGHKAHNNGLVLLSGETQSRI